MGMIILDGTDFQIYSSYVESNFVNSDRSTIFVFSSASLIKWAPADNPNRPITDKKEIKKFRILSMIYIVIWLVLSLTLVYFKQNMFVLALCLGVILEVFSITPAGIRFFKMIEKGMDSVKNDINRHSSK